MGTVYMREIISPNVIGVSPEALVSEAVEVMRTHNISCIVALDRGRPKGILTERNILQAAALEGNGFIRKPINRFMSAPVVTVTGDMHIYEAYHILARRKMRHLVVVDAKGQALGVITLSNLVEHLERNYLAGIKRIAEIMTDTLVTAPREVTVKQALVIMAQRAISCVVAVEDNRAAGILTERDVVRLLAQGLDIEEVLMDEVMSRPVFIVAADRPAHEVAQLMKRQNVRRMVVVDQDQRVAGVITQSDIVRGLEGKYVKTLKQFLFEKSDLLEEAERSLLEKSVFLENILHSSLDQGIVAVDACFRTAYYNPAAQEIVNRPPEDILGRDIRSLHATLGLPEGLLDRALHSVTPEKRHDFEFEVERQGGRRVIKAAVSGIWDEFRVLHGFVLMLRDVTEERRTQDALEDVNFHLERQVARRTRDLARRTRELEEANTRLLAMDQMKSDFLSAVSHELRTPLTSLLGFAKLVQRDFRRLFSPLAHGDLILEKKSRQIVGNLAILEYEGERLTRLINNFLDLSKIEAGRMQWNDQPLAPAAVVEHAVQAVWGLFTQKPQLELKVDASPDLPQLLADPDRMVQVLINLLNNATKFTEKGRVTVRASVPRPGLLLFEVADTGPGVSEADRQLIFDKFHQVWKGDTVADDRKGTGLGLAICREIVDHYQGRIWVEPGDEGGSVFRVELPLG